MENNTKKLKYFKKYLNAFFMYHLDRESKPEEIELLHNYTDYLNRANYMEQIFSVDNVQALAEIHCEGNKEPDIQGASFVAGINLATEIHNKIALIQTETIQKLEKEVKFLKNKNKKLQTSMLERIKVLEQSTKLKPQVLSVAHKAFNAAVQACMPTIKIINSVPTVKIKTKYNFRTWCNKIDKYGKAKSPFAQGKYLEINMDAIPKEEFVPVRGLAKKPMFAQARKPILAPNRLPL